MNKKYFWIKKFLKKIQKINLSDNFLILYENDFFHIKFNKNNKS